jgi:hypothetical protein
LFAALEDRFTHAVEDHHMSDLLAIVGPTDGDEDLLRQIASRRPKRVTVLVEESQDDSTAWALDETDAGRALRDRLAKLLHEIEARTGAAVVGLVGDADQLVGWRFDRVVRAPAPIAA